MTPSNPSGFPQNYAAARAAFMMAAAEAGARLFQYVQPCAFAPGGGTLSCDVAVLGPGNAHKAFVAIAGTHGVEGPTGSMAHTTLLCSGLAQLAPDCRVLLVHAINPYGYACMSRTNENNVDLNRNFIDHAAPHPANDLYAQVHAIVCQSDYSPEQHARQMAALHAWTAEHGADARNRALVAGQYSHPSGKSYGGRRREWSNQVLQQIAEEHLRGIEKVAFIDWHTGLGRYGEELLLCFNDPGTPEYGQCERWWGHDRITTQEGFDGARRPSYRGLLFNGLQRFVAPAQFAGVAVEFGILSNEAQEGIFMLDHWLRYGNQAAVPAATLEDVRRQVREAFTPADPEWRRSVAERSRALMEQALRGLQAW